MGDRTKEFDCVEMQHRGAALIRRRLRGMTREEELAFWARGTAELLRRKETLAASSAALRPQRLRRDSSQRDREKRIP